VTFDKFVQLIELFCVILFFCHVRCINFVVVACAFEVIILLINIHSTTTSLFIYRHNKR